MSIFIVFIQNVTVLNVFFSGKRSYVAITCVCVSLSHLVPMELVALQHIAPFPSKTYIKHITNPHYDTRWHLITMNVATVIFSLLQSYTNYATTVDNHKSTKYASWINSPNVTFILVQVTSVIKYAAALLVGVFWNIVTHCGFRLLVVFFQFFPPFSYPFNCLCVIWVLVIYRLLQYVQVQK